MIIYNLYPVAQDATPIAGEQIELLSYKRPVVKSLLGGQLL